MKHSFARYSQIFFLVLFLFLFVQTDYRGHDEISLAINSFFRADPLVVVSYILSAKTLSWLLLPGIIMILLSLLLGRFFCGWICPLGTIIDLVTVKIRKTRELSFLKTNVKYYLLFTLLFLALFNINLSGVFDPIAILIRFLTFSVYPLFGSLVREGWVSLYTLTGETRDIVRPIYNFFRDYLIPFRETFYPLAFLSFLLFGAIIFLERFEKRNWCKNLCPLGTLLGLFSKFSVFKRLPFKLCADCRQCKDTCPTAFDQETLQKENCILCMDCSLKCGLKRVKFVIAPIKTSELKIDNGRRTLIGSFLSGFILSKYFIYLPGEKQSRLLRPPGVANESDFLKKCVRCGECMKICLRNALYPSYTESGAYGLFTPVLIPRKGYCEYNCTLCGQVCPTKAIPELPVQTKKRAVIGIAAVDKNHCLPYSKKINCIVCEEHCPIPNKAIRLESVREKDYAGNTVILKKPYVVDELCNGCGICEYVCPLEGKSGIDVYSKKNVKGSGYGGSGNY